MIAFFKQKLDHVIDQKEKWRNATGAFWRNSKKKVDKHWTFFSNAYYFLWRNLFSKQKGLKPRYDYSARKCSKLDFLSLYYSYRQCTKKLNMYVKLNECKQTFFQVFKIDLPHWQRWKSENTLSEVNLFSRPEKVCLHSFNFTCTFNFFVHCQ